LISLGSESVVGAAFLRKATVQHMVGIKNEGLTEINFINRKEFDRRRECSLCSV